MVNATNFDGSTDYFLRAGGLTGISDGNTGLVSYWTKPDAVVAVEFVVSNDALGFSVDNAGDDVRILADNSVGTEILNVNSVGDPLTAGQWNHVLIAFTTGGTIQIYVNDIDRTGTPNTNTADDIDYTKTNWSVGARYDGLFKFAGCLSEVYVNIAETLDLSVVANRRKFVTADIEAVDLGSDGSIPTGSAPAIYLPNAFSSFGTNAGTGGDLTDQGSVAACVDAPGEGVVPLPSGLHRPTKRYVLPDGRQFGDEAEARAELAKIQAQERAIRAANPLNKKWTLPAEPQPEPPPMLPNNSWQLPPKKLTLPKKTYRLPPKKKLKRPRDFTGWPDIKD